MRQCRKSIAIIDGEQHGGICGDPIPPDTPYAVPHLSVLDQQSFVVLLTMHKWGCVEGGDELGSPPSSPSPPSTCAAREKDSHTGVRYVHTMSLHALAWSGGGARGAPLVVRRPHGLWGGGG